MRAIHWECRHEDVSRELGCSGLLAFGASAAHADGYPVRDFSPAVSDNDWSGFFINGSVGYGWGDTGFKITELESGESVKTSGEPDGFLGSVGLGYDWTFGRGLVFGVFGDYTIGELDDDLSFGSDTFPFKASYDNIWAIGARAGYVIHKDLLLYGTLGYTHADFELKSVGFKESDDVDGFFVGAGLERELCDNLYLKGEYRFSDFGDTKFRVVEGGGCGGECEFNNKLDHDIHSIRVGLSYKFGSRREEAVPLK